MQSKPPCKDCQNRCVGCHATCKPYVEYTTYRRNELEMLRKDRFDEYHDYRQVQRRKKHGK